MQLQAKEQLFFDNCAYLTFVDLLKKLIGLSLCVGLCACSSLMDEKIPGTQSPAAAPKPPICSESENQHWNISSAGQKITVTHNYRDGHESCEKEKPASAPERVIKSAKDSSIQDLVSGHAMAAAIDFELDPADHNAGHSTTHFSAI